MKVMVEQEKIPVYFVGTFGKNSTTFEDTAFGIEIEVSEVAYRRWQFAMKSFRKAQNEIMACIKSH
jgi:hypothetical protein